MQKSFFKVIEEGDSVAQKAQFFEESFFAATGERVNYAELTRDENGKPVAVKKQHFSLTHSEQCYALAISDEGEIGTDIEMMTHAKKLQGRRLERILKPGEKAVNGNFLNNFVIKEAFSKIDGRGLGVGLQKYDANELIKKYRAKDNSTDEYIWWILQGSNL